MHAALSVRDLDGLERQIVDRLLESEKGVSQSDLAARLTPLRSQPTVSRTMKALINKGIIEKCGATRGAVFRLTPEAAWFARPPHLRPAVTYDPGRIGHYEPNRTQWLPENLRLRIAAAAKGASGNLDASTYSRQIAERFLIDLSWASSALEGNTYDYLDTEALVKYGERAEGHDPIEVTMILNHKNAIGSLLEVVGSDVLHMRFAQRLHALLMRDLISPEDLGRVRANAVRIGGSSYQPSADRHQLESDFSALLWKAAQVKDPAEASFLLLAGTAYLQSFVDGNKRLGRLLCNAPLLWAGMPPLSFVDISKGHYLSGMIAFYELGDPRLLAETVVAAYEQGAPTYRAALAVHRVPRTVEIRERTRIERLVLGWMRRTIEGEPQDGREVYLRDAVADLQPEEADVLVTVMEEVLDAISPVNAAAWGIPSDLAETYREILSSPPEATSCSDMEP